MDGWMETSMEGRLDGWRLGWDGRMDGQYFIIRDGGRDGWTMTRPHLWRDGWMVGGQREGWRLGWLLGWMGR